MLVARQTAASHLAESLIQIRRKSVTSPGKDERLGTSPLRNHPDIPRMFSSDVTEATLNVMYADYCTIAPLSRLDHPRDHPRNCEDGSEMMNLNFPRSQEHSSAVCAPPITSCEASKETRSSSVRLIVRTRTHLLEVVMASAAEPTHSRRWTTRRCRRYLIQIIGALFYHNCAIVEAQIEICR